MSTRALKPLDLPILYFYRRKMVCFETACRRVQNQPFSAHDFLPAFIHNQASLCAVEEGVPPLMGCVYKAQPTHLASLRWMGPRQACEEKNLSGLLIWMAARLPSSQSLFLRAELPADDALNALLRANGFSIWTWQQILTCTDTFPGSGEQTWRKAVPADWASMQRLYHQSAPDPLRWVEAPERLPAEAWVYLREGHLTAWAQVLHGSRGSLILPVFKTNLSAPRRVWRALMGRLNARAQPLYLRLRAHQIWLASALGDLCQTADGPENVLFKPLSASIPIAKENSAAQSQSYATPALPFKP